MRKMLVNALHPEEARVAIVEDGQLVELDIEIAGKEQIRGNIYKGTVVRVEPGLQAAFIDIGLKKLGFLQMGELHPDFWQWRDDVAPENRKSRPRIQEVLRRGQELIVQVEKGERDMKGAALTSFLSLPGRYMVLMPGSDSTGVSRKVENETERKKLKEVAAQLDIPEGFGYIIRTEAAGKRKTELNKDIQFLVKLYGEIRDKGRQTKAPALIYRESGVVTRTIRDYFTVDIDEILVDSEEVYQEARLFFKQTMPKHEKVVKLHQEKRPIFSKYQLEEQIDLIHEKKVPLKSGGSLVIEPTEALVSIDVNSGKSTGEKGVEDTAFRTNMEAAEEVGRQLRLRDLGGLIVIDFIDMRDRKHASEVEKTLKNSLKSDKARVTIGRISQFGMLEMSRQRIRPMLEEASYLNCPHCEGRGKVKSVETMALSFLRKVHAAAAKGTVAEVMGGLPLEVAYYLLNRKKREIAGIEDDYDIQVTIKGKPSFLMNQLELDTARREKPAADHEHHPVHQPITAQTAQAAMEMDFTEEAEETEELSQAPAAAAGEEQPTTTEGGKKRKRKRKKKKGAATAGEATEGAEEAEAPPASAEPTAAEGAPEAGETSPEGEQTTEGGKKKRRRRRRRGKGGAGAPTAAGETAEEQQPEPVQPQAAPAEESAVPPRTKPSHSRKKKAPATETAPAPTPVPAPTPAPAEAPEPKAAPGRGRKKAGAKKPAETPAAAATVPVAAPASPAAAPEAPKPTRPRRPEKKRGPAPEVATVQPAPPPVEAAAEKAAKPRKPRGAGKAPQAAPAAAVPVAPQQAEATAAPARKPRGKAPAAKPTGSDTATPAPAKPVQKRVEDQAPPAAPKKPTRPRKKKPAAE